MTDHTDVGSLALTLEQLEQAVALGERLGLRDELDQARAVLAQASDRRRLAPEITVAALLGATGSGKSSLANALTGVEVSRTARTRPTTTQPSPSCRIPPSRPPLCWTGSRSVGG